MADGEAAPTTEQTTDTKAAPERPLSLLASEMFGSAYTGEVKKKEEPEAAPAEPAEASAEEPEPGEAEEASQEGDESAAELESESEDDSEGAEERPIQTLSELIEHYEWDQDWLNEIKVPVKVNGESGEATLKDLVDGYQMSEAAEKRLSEAKTKAKEIQEEASKKAAELDQQFSVAAKLIERAEEMVNDDVSSVDWAKLRQEDPAEYAAKKDEIKERRERIQELKQEAITQYQEGLEKQKTESQAQLQQRLEAEQAALLEKLPEWQDADKAKAGKAKLAEYLLGQGFAREDVLGASDHRLILLAEKARRWDEIKSSSDVARKKVAKVPKVMKPGAPKPQEQQAKEKQQKLRNRLKQSGSIEDAYAVLKARQTGGR